jgi:hypothetical protein
LIRSHPLIPWWIGIRGGHETKSIAKDYDDFCQGTPQKTKLLSVICSRKAVTKQHIARLRFVERLQAELGDSIDVFGFGFNPIEDKWDAITPYRYHVGIENSRSKDYWTEKVADCFLGGAMLLYDGCPNLHEYFPSEAFLRIDRNKTEQSLATIKAILNSEAFAQAQGAIDASRRLVLDRYNIFPSLVNLVSTLPTQSARTFSIEPQWAERPSLVHRIRRRLYRIFC